MPDQKSTWLEIAGAIVINFLAIHGYLTLVAHTTVLRSATLTLISLAVAALGAFVYRVRRPPK